MRRLFALTAIAMLALGPVTGVSGGEPAVVAIPGGSFRPLYSLSEAETQVQVPPFQLDVSPVTNAAFLAFVTDKQSWRRGQVAALFADEGYLSHWAGPLELGGAGPQEPVTRVSWFAAKAYCESRGARLPTELEWEYAAAASTSQADGRQEAAWQEVILSWYARPTSHGLSTVGQGEPNYYGVHDLHGLVWEWVLEFNSTLVSSDSRESANADATRFCGAGAVTASDKSDYASFMRYAFRSSLLANYTTSALGFRCAQDIPKPHGVAP